MVKHLLTKLRLCFVFLSFLFACVAAAMRRDVRRSRFQVGHLEDGEPRPQARKLVFVSPYRLELPTVPVLLTGAAASSQCTARARLDCALRGDVRKCLPLSRICQARTSAFYSWTGKPLPFQSICHLGPAGLNSAEL